MSLYLPEQKLGSHSTEGSSSNKFMLKGRQTGAMHRGHSWVFRAESYETMLAWFEDIKILTEKSPQERNAFVRQHARSVSGTSQKAGSISSDGIMDEEDEEPFSASASAVAAPGPKQDELPKRPQPGGRFPSTDLIVNPERGLQAPLSPSSGSSGFGDVQDRDVAAASALPGSGVGQHYAEDASTSPTHAAMINHYAQQDGVNPYTNQRIYNHHETHVPAEQAAAGFTAAGLGGAALGVAGAGVYQHHEQDEETKKLKNQAALESAQVAAPDTDAQNLEAQDALESANIAASDANAHNLEAQATREAVLVAAPDTLQDIPSDEEIMSGGRSAGDLSVVGGIPHQNAALPTPTASNPIEEALKPLTGDTRPTLAAGQHHQSVQSVSQLHIPGEFPKKDQGEDPTTF
jgi:hypothetical protein